VGVERVGFTIDFGHVMMFKWALSKDGMAPFLTRHCETSDAFRCPQSLFDPGEQNETMVINRCDSGNGGGVGLRRE
jgi:hypothetical protein